MNKKLLAVVIIAILALTAIPLFLAFAVTPKPKIVVRLDVPLKGVTGSGSSEEHGDNVIFHDLEWGEGAGGVTLTIVQWLPNPAGDPSHIPAPSILAPFPVTHRYTGGDLEATAHGNRDAYTGTGKWHMEFTITFMIDGVASGFNLRHDCNAVGTVHCATWDGEGFGAFEGVKVAGVSYADLTIQPVVKHLSGEVSGGFDNLPPRNIPEA